MKIKILLNEPYYRDSHKYWADNLVKFSEHEITLLSLPGRHWKWRMQGSALHFAIEYNKLKEKPDLIICSTMMDVAFYKSMLNHDKNRKRPIIVYYMHENQLAYPFSKCDTRQNEDFHYGFINYKSCMAADYVLFNSEFNRKSFLSGLKSLLKRLPDYNYADLVITAIYSKSSISFVGLDLEIIDDSTKNCNDKDPTLSPTLLWSHRWEEDKQPSLFYELCTYLEDKNCRFNLILLGNAKNDKTGTFMRLKQEFSSYILLSGYQESYSQYIEAVSRADILPVTTNHEFYGLSVMEAIYCGVYPILPEGLVYTELYSEPEFKDCFYRNKVVFFEKVHNLIKFPLKIKRNKDYILKNHQIYNLIKMIDLYIIDKIRISPPL